MTKKSKIRTIITIVLCVFILLPVIFGLLRLATGGQGPLSEFLTKAHLDFWKVEYNNKQAANLSIAWDEEEVFKESQLVDQAYILSRENTSYGLFSSMKVAKDFCDTLYVKGGAFGLATLVKILTVITAVVALFLIVVQSLRFRGMHFNALENALSYALLFTSVVSTAVSFFFFLGTTCRMLSSDYMGHSMKFVAEIGWYLATLLPVALGLFLVTTKPYEVKTEEE